ncbi:MAG: HAD family phosphatase [Bacteroidaceae bacterium]|nr:HAD family phosphatase [Bacteroidaceae bacterium]
MALDRNNLIFDLGGVLLNINPRATADAFASMGVDKVLISDCFNLVNPVLRGLECGTVAPDELYSLVAGSMGLEVTPEVVQRIKDVWCSMLLDAPVEKFRRLRALREQGYKVFLLSNTNAIHWEMIERIVCVLEGRRLADYFDGVYLSFEMHLCKPDVAIFEQLLAAEGVAAADCIFFDDTPANCEAAASLGIDAYLLERNGAWPEWLIG